MTHVHHADVGDHPGSEMQAHVPIDTLRALSARPGDTLQFEVEGDEATVRVLPPEAFTEKERREAAVEEFKERVRRTVGEGT